MLKRDAFGAARLLESKADEVFPEGTSISAIRVTSSGEWGVQVAIHDDDGNRREVNYTNLHDVHRFLNEYLDKLRQEVGDGA